MIRTAPTANLVPRFICPELYLPVSGVVQRPPHRLVRLLHPRNIHARREGIMKAHDGGFNAPRHGDFRERAPAATDRDHGARRAHDQCVTHLTHPRRERDVDVRVRFARIIPGQDADREPAGLLRAPRRGRRHAAQPAAQQHRAPRGAVERHAVMQREHGQRVRADLVGEVAVRRDAVGADDHEVHLRLAHQRARDGVGNDGARDPGMPELPGREPGALEHRPRFVDEDVQASPGFVGEIEGRERGSDPAGRERTRVAVGEHLGAVRDERQSRLPDPPTHGTVFFPDGRRLGLEPLPDARAPPAVRRLRRDTRHAVERPAQVHGGGPRRREQPRQLVEPGEKAVARRRPQLPHARDETHRRRDPDERRTTQLQGADRVRTLQLRGAPLIGIAAAMGLVAGMRELRAAPRDRFLARLDELARLLAATRPTAVNLRWALDRMARVAAETPDSWGGSGVWERLQAEATAIWEEDRAMCRRIGEAGLPLIPDGAKVLTHCNAGALATGGIGTALAPLYLAHEAGRRLHVFVDETRPVLQGARLTAWELGHAGVPCTVIADAVAGSLMRQAQVDLVIVGADRIAANGDFANKIGTYPLAVLALHHGVPFYCAAPSTTIDAALADGDGIPIEQRGPEEVKTIAGRPVAPAAAAALNPAFDVTPARYVSAFVPARALEQPRLGGGSSPTGRTVGYNRG